METTSRVWAVGDWGEWMDSHGELIPVEVIQIYHPPDQARPVYCVATHRVPQAQWGGNGVDLPVHWITQDDLRESP